MPSSDGGPRWVHSSESLELEKLGVSLDAGEWMEALREEGPWLSWYTRTRPEPELPVNVVALAVCQQKLLFGSEGATPLMR